MSYPSYVYKWNMPKKQLKVIQQECVDFLNQLAEKNEIEVSDWKVLEAFKGEMTFLPTGDSLNDVNAVMLLLKIKRTKPDVWELINDEPTFLTPPYFKIRP